MNKVKDVFARAKAYGLLDAGWVGSFADVVAAVDAFEDDRAAAEAEYFHPDEDGEKAFLAWAEGGWHGGRYDDLAEDQANSPFDPVWGGPIEQVGFIINGVKVVKPDFNEENDPDGEAENAWHEQLGDQWAEARASRWFEDRGADVPMAFA